MTRCWTVWIVGLALVLPALAQESPEPADAHPQPKPIPDFPQPPRGSHGVAEMLKRTMDQLKLDEEQRAKAEELAAQIRKKYAQEGRRDKAIAIRQKRQEAKQRGERELADKYARELKALRGDNEIKKEFYEAITPLLRPEQVARLERIRTPLRARGGEPAHDELHNILQIGKQLQLDEQQSQRFEELAAELREAVKAPNPAEEALLKKLQKAVDDGRFDDISPLRKELEEVRQSDPPAIAAFFEKLEPILNAEQRQKLAEIRAEVERKRGPDARELLRLVRRLELSDAQKELMKELEKQAREKLRDAGRDKDKLAEANATIEQQLRSILTPEQSAKLDSLLKKGGTAAARQGPRVVQPRAPAKSQDSSGARIGGGKNAGKKKP